MSHESWPLDDNHSVALMAWDCYPAALWFLNFIYRVHNKILALANRYAPRKGTSNG
jgi:hypothetical protein